MTKNTAAKDTPPPVTAEPADHETQPAAVPQMAPVMAAPDPAVLAEAMLADPMAAAAAELERVSSQNQARLRALAVQGAQVDPASALSLRIDVMAEMVFGAGSLQLLQYKLRVQNQLATGLRQLEGQVRQAQIAAAAQASPEQVQQMAKASGLVGPGGKPIGG